MSKYELVNKVTHKDITIEQSYSAEYGHNTGGVMVLPNEFAAVQREYPIVFNKNINDQKTIAIAMLGFSLDENLFLTDEGVGWDGSYVPAMFAKGPFMIGYHNQSQSGGSEKAGMVYVDMEDPRVNVDGGYALFNEDGSNTPYMDSVTRGLADMHQGADTAERMYEMLEEMDLIEPLSIEVKLYNGDSIKVTGNYTIKRKKLLLLDGDDLAKLNKPGYLYAAYLMVSSLDNVNRLISLKNTKLMATEKKATDGNSANEADKRSEDS